MNEYLRTRALQFFNEKGVIRSFVARKLGIPKQMLSAFLLGEGKLKADVQYELDQLIDSYYYLPIKEA